MTTRSHALDIARRAGWLPEEQDDLESWLAGHRDRTEAMGEQAVLHPVLTEFQGLIDTDPVARMRISQMITQVPPSKPYRRRGICVTFPSIVRPDTLCGLSPSCRPEPGSPTDANKSS